MVSNVNELERSFYKQRERILKALKKEEDVLKKDMSKLTVQLGGLKSKQSKIASMDRDAKRRVRDLEAKLIRMHKQQVSDAQTVKFMKARIRQLSREIPAIERTIKKSVPDIRKYARMDRKLERILKPLDKKVGERQKAIAELRLKMRKLAKKEDFIKKGTIVWGEFRKHVKKRPAKKADQKQERKGGILDVFRRK
jgi:hypothetical protein